MSKQWYGSLNNRMMERTLQPVPTVGMDATVSGYSDRYAYTVTEISKETITVTQSVNKDGKTIDITRTYPRKIKAVEDNAKLTSGNILEHAQVYEFTPGDPENARTYIFHKKSGTYKKESYKWVKDETITRAIATERGLNHFGGTYEPSNRTKQDNETIILGTKQKYYDPSF